MLKAFHFLACSAFFCVSLGALRSTFSGALTAGFTSDLGASLHSILLAFFFCVQSTLGAGLALEAIATEDRKSVV
jgi:hypothetical protein